jgi:hypothetical protein
MLGSKAPDGIPGQVEAAVKATHDRLRLLLGNVRLEWVYDGASVWVVQLHVAGAAQEFTLSPGAATEWIDYDPAEGLEVLRTLVRELEDSDVGVIVMGNVGITSHVGDLLRKSRIPARFASAAE